MQQHRFDLGSAVMGLVAVVLGIVVAWGRVDSLATNAAWWLAVLAVLIGLALLPRRPRPAPPGTDAPGPT